MQPKWRTFMWTRLAVVVWASLWMLAAPLFHVHPEADHLHGQVGHVHGGTVHTAWSPDLDCEFDSHWQVDRTEQSTQDCIGNRAQFSHVGDRHAEFSLSLLSDSTDRKSLKPVLQQALGFSPAVVSDLEWYARIQGTTTHVSTFMPFIHAIASRAPPSLLI